jgi:hypothetical protein
MKTCLMILASTALTMGAVSAEAAVVYNNGAPNNVNGNETTAWVQAEQFSFGGATNVAGAGVYLAGSGTYDGNFQYYIFADAAGTPGSVLASGSVTPTITDTGVPWPFGGNTRLFAFNFNSIFNAAAGTTYWLGIHASSDFARDEIYWVTTAANATATGFESSGGTFNNWFNNGQEHAFYLEGARIGGAVPEPATWALMIGGFALAGAAARARRTTVRYA